MLNSDTVRMQRNHSPGFAGRPFASEWKTLTERRKYAERIVPFSVSSSSSVCSRNAAYKEWEIIALSDSESHKWMRTNEKKPRQTTYQTGKFDTFCFAVLRLVSLNGSNQLFVKRDIARGNNGYMKFKLLLLFYFLCLQLFVWSNIK